MPLLRFPPILATRRNHAIEHATLHILARKYPGRHFAGHSNPTGFFVLGNVPTEDVASAALRALTRLRAGERHLAIHAGCGTNFATSAMLAGTLAWFALSGARSNRGLLRRLPFALALAVFGFVLSQPLGPALQARVTTEADPGEMQIVEVVPVNRRGVAIHRVITR